MYYFESSINQQIDDGHGSVALGYAPYLSLTFNLITASVILLLSGWVVYTIKATTSLHKPYNIFVANLLVSDMVVAVLIFAIQCSMMISYQLEVELLTNCYAYKFVVLGPLLTNDFSILILICDRLIAMVFPSMYQRMMTRYVVVDIISGAWFLAVIPAIVYMAVFDDDNVLGVPEYGVCVFERNSYIKIV